MPAFLSSDLVTGIISFLFTMMILSYLIGDNPAFRVAVYVFVGVSAGYAAAVTWWQVLFPRVILPLLSGDLTARLLALIALILGILLLMKLSPRTAALGSPSMAFLVGVGAAVALAGAVLGTIIPQSQAAVNLFNLPSAGENWAERLIFAALMLLGTIATLAYFQFGARSSPQGPHQGRLVVLLGWLGRIFIAITFGALFAGVLLAALAALIERFDFIWSFLEKLL